MSLEGDLSEGAVVVERHARVKQQIAVVALVDGALAIQIVEVAAEHVAFDEIGFEVVDDGLLVGNQLVRRRDVLGDGREVRVIQLIGLAVGEQRVGRLKVDFAQPQLIFHFEVGVALDHLPLELEHHNRDGAFGGLDGLVIGIKFGGETHKRSEADAVAALEHVGVVVVERVADDGGDAHFGAERRAHPKHVVIAPLDIDGVTAHQEVENFIGAIAAIEKISDDVQSADGKALDQIAEHFDKFSAGFDLDDGLKKFVVVNGLGAVELGVGADQLDDYGLKFIGDFGADGRGGVLIGHKFGELDEAGNGDAIPLGGVVNGGKNFFHFLARVIDEGAELGALFSGEAAIENVIDLLSNDAGAVVYDVEEGGELAVEVADKVLGGLGQRQLRFEMNDLLVDGLLRGILIGKVAEHLRR